LNPSDERAGFLLQRDRLVLDSRKSLLRLDPGGAILEADADDAIVRKPSFAGKVLDGARVGMHAHGTLRASNPRKRGRFCGDNGEIVDREVNWQPAQSQFFGSIRGSLDFHSPAGQLLKLGNAVERALFLKVGGWARLLSRQDYPQEESAYGCQRE
jgi:hypothetical protein